MGLLNRVNKTSSPLQSIHVPLVKFFYTIPLFSAFCPNNAPLCTEVEVSNAAFGTHVPRQRIHMASQFRCCQYLMILEIALIMSSRALILWLQILRQIQSLLPSSNLSTVRDKGPLVLPNAIFRYQKSERFIDHK